MAAHLAGLLAFSNLMILHWRFWTQHESRAAFFASDGRNSACTLWGMFSTINAPPQHVAAQLTGLLACSNLMILHSKLDAAAQTLRCALCS